MAALSVRPHILPGSRAGRKLVGATLPRSGVLARSWRSRIASVEDERNSKEFKIARLAQVLGCELENVETIVRVWPGLLVPDCSLYEERVTRLAHKYQVPHEQVGQIVLSNPAILFQRV